MRLFLPLEQLEDIAGLPTGLILDRARWLIPAIPAFWEAEAGGSRGSGVQDQLD